MFGAVNYFVVPKSFLGQGLRMSLLVKDEQEPSLVSFPTEVVGQVQAPDGYENLG